MKFETEAPISAREYRKLSTKDKLQLKIKVEKQGMDYDDYIKGSEKLFPRGGKKNPITWRNR